MAKASRRLLGILAVSCVYATPLRELYVNNTGRLAGVHEYEAEQLAAFESWSYKPDPDISQQIAYKYFPIHKTVISAREHCQQYNSSLATVPTYMQNEFMREVAKAAGDRHDMQAFWIGFMRVTKSSTNWMWHDGSSYTYTNWFPGQPNHRKGHEDAVAVCGGGMFLCQNGTEWYDLPSLVKLPFMCSRQAVNSDHVFVDDHPHNSWLYPVINNVTHHRLSYKYFQASTTFRQANDHCSEMNATLAVARNHEENDFLKKMAYHAGPSYAHKDFWIGFTETGSGLWHWPDGVTMANVYTNWAASEPSNPGGSNADSAFICGLENYSMCGPDEDFMWYDALATDARPYICSRLAADWDRPYEAELMDPEFYLERVEIETKGFESVYSYWVADRIADGWYRNDDGEWEHKTFYSNSHPCRHRGQERFFFGLWDNHEVYVTIHEKTKAKYNGEYMIKDWNGRGCTDKRDEGLQPILEFEECKTAATTYFKEAIGFAAAIPDDLVTIKQNNGPPGCIMKGDPCDKNGHLHFEFNMNEDDDPNNPLSAETGYHPICQVFLEYEPVEKKPVHPANHTQPANETLVKNETTAPVDPVPVVTTAAPEPVTPVTPEPTVTEAPDDDEDKAAEQAAIEERENRYRMYGYLFVLGAIIVLTTSGAMVVYATRLYSKAKEEKVQTQINLRKIEEAQYYNSAGGNSAGGNAATQNYDAYGTQTGGDWQGSYYNDNSPNDDLMYYPDAYQTNGEPQPPSNTVVGRPTRNEQNASSGVQAPAKDDAERNEDVVTGVSTLEIGTNDVVIDPFEPSDGGSFNRVREANEQNGGYANRGYSNGDEGTYGEYEGYEGYENNGYNRGGSVGQYSSQQQNQQQPW